MKNTNPIFCVEGFERRIWIGRLKIEGDDFLIESAVMVRYWNFPDGGLPGILLVGPKAKGVTECRLDACPPVKVNILRVVNRYELSEALWVDFIQK